jgi:hypothetical protein
MFWLLKTPAIHLGTDLITWPRHLEMLTFQWLIADNEQDAKLVVSDSG